MPSKWRGQVRGEPMPRELFALTGFEQMRAAFTSLAPSPLEHLVGLVPTQIGHGVVSMRMPASPWILHPDGGLEFVLLASTAALTAGTTVLPAGHLLKPKTHAYSQLRPCPADGRRILGRGRVVHTAPDLIFVESTVEDENGRMLAQSASQMLVVPIKAPPKGSPNEPPVAPPTYSTPDPYLRPLPSDKRLVFEMFQDLGCMELADAVFADGTPAAPLYDTLGITLAAEGYAEGRVALTMDASPWCLGWPPFVLPGWIETLAFDAAGAACHTLMEPGTLAACLAFTFTHLDTVEPTGQAVVASARAQKVADDVLLSQVDIVEAGGKPVASGAFTARPIPLPRPKRSETKRILATVLFTDIVDSTRHVNARGDQKWSDLLEEHQAAVRAALQEFDGREIKTTGDGFLATFESPTRAVLCARRIRDRVQALGLQIRAGVHTGEIEVTRGDVAGIGVHLASRIESTAAPGQILVSDSVRTLASLDAAQFADEGRRTLKGIEGEVQLYAVAD